MGATRFYLRQKSFICRLSFLKSPMNFIDSRLFRGTVLLLFVVLFFFGLVRGAPFLQPLAIGLIVAFLLLPIAQWLEKIGANRVLASLLASLVGALFVAVLGGLIVFQAGQVSDDWEQLKKKGAQRMEEVKSWVSDKTGIEKQQMDKMGEKRDFKKILQSASSVATVVLVSLADLLLVLVYTILFLLYRGRFKGFVLRWADNDQKDEAVQTLRESGAAARDFLKAKFILILILMVVYSIGLTLIGVKFAIFYGVLAALLTIIPYIGNFIGASFPLVMTLIYQDLTATLLVMGLFSAVQLLESYVLEPLLVKKNVDLNPFFSISAAILAGTVWGVAGMIIAIPYLAILYIFTRHLKGMKPFAYLLGGGESEEK